ncbi:flagellar hook-length control protein FliK, partial [Phreatobacter sp. AB_2022a]|uniref:flagellar hook-length control protein FliK n=1 Tax=Phreatobacter sp. AB_2022a TaxID=3003134 RepID=UPI00228705C2
AARLIERTEAALARLVLLQAASLPEARDLGRPELAPQTWMELPVRIGQATAMVPFQIGRDRGEDDAPAARGAAPPGGWVMRFSLAAEPLGPVHAAVRWRDGHVRVQLWAERDGIAARLDEARTALSDALEASAFTVDQLTILAGRPAESGLPPAQPRLDRRT